MGRLADLSIQPRERVRAVEQLFDSQGYLVSPARGFTGLLNTFSRVYSYRWDEALRHFPENARAMRNDCYLTALNEERTIPLTRWPWEIQLDAEDDPSLKDDPDAEKIRVGLTAVVKRTSRVHEMRDYLRESPWFGRYGSQVVWRRENQSGRWLIARHSPVDGDSILTDFDGYPCVAISPLDKAKYGDEAVNTDRMTALRLRLPEYRSRFIIARHRVRAGDYYHPETAGMVGGVGLRHQVYWAWWLRDEMLASAVAFLDKVGTMGLLCVYYEEGNAKSEAKADKTAAEISRRSVLKVPVPKGKDPKTAGVELIPANMTGVDFLKGFIGDYFERHIERLFVGQSSSASSEGSKLGGNSDEFQQDTKQQIIESDAEAMDAAYTEDLLTVAQDLNYPGSRSKYRYRFKHLLPDPTAAKKLAAIKSGWGMGVEYAEAEVRELSGGRKPNEGEKTIGNKQGQSSEPGGGPEDDPSRAGRDQEGGVAGGSDYSDPDFGGEDEYRYEKDQRGHDHKGKGSGGGQFTGNGGNAAASNPKGGGSDAASKPIARTGLFGKLRSVGSAVADTKLVRAAVAVEHKIAAAAHKTREIAERAAAERGLTPEQSGRLKRVLAVGDFVGGWAAGGATAAVAGPLAGKVVSLTLPSASALYLAYSTARNPAATWRAAKAAVKATSLSPKAAAADIATAWRGESHHADPGRLFLYSEDEGGADLGAVAGELADRLARSPDPDAFEALWLAALAHAGNADAALKLLDMIEQQGGTDDEGGEEEEYRYANDKQPRRPKGKGDGGQFAPKGGGGSAASSSGSRSDHPAVGTASHGKLKARVESRLPSGWRETDAAHSHQAIEAEAKTDYAGAQAKKRTLNKQVRDHISHLSTGQLYDLIRLHSGGIKEGYGDFAKAANELILSRLTGQTLAAANAPGIDGVSENGDGTNFKFSAGSKPKLKWDKGDTDAAEVTVRQMLAKGQVFSRLCLVTSGDREKRGLYVWHGSLSENTSLPDNGDGIDRPKRVVSLEEFQAGIRGDHAGLKAKIAAAYDLSPKDRKRALKRMDESIKKTDDQRADDLLERAKSDQRIASKLASGLDTSSLSDEAASALFAKLQTRLGKK